MDSTATIQDRLKMLFERIGVKNPTAFSKYLGYDKPENVLRIFRDERFKPGTDILIDIANRIPQLNMGWLLTGSGEMFNTEISVKPIIAVAEDFTPYQTPNKTPLYDVDVAAGIGNAVFGFDKKDIQGFYSIPEFDKVDFMLRVRGNSMWPNYNNGDIVACRVLKNHNLIQWNKTYVVATADDGLIIKRLRRGADDKHYTLVSDNAEYEPMHIPKADVAGLAQVIGGVWIE